MYEANLKYAVKESTAFGKEAPNEEMRQGSSLTGARHSSQALKLSLKVRSSSMYSTTPVFAGKFQSLPQT